MASAGDPQALGELLRSRRERLAPADVGLPPGTRRRTAGLRREEVAQLASVSVTYYTFLEQGRQARPSEQVLDALAAALRMTSAALSSRHRSPSLSRRKRSPVSSHASSRAKTPRSGVELGCSPGRTLASSIPTSPVAHSRA